MDERRKFLEELVETQTEKIEDFSNSVRDLLAQIKQAEDDLTTFQAALEAYTRDSDTPYKPTEVSKIGTTPLLIKGQENEKPKTNGHKPVKSQEKSANTSQPTKTGIIRNVFISHGKDLTVDELFAGIPSGLSFEFRKADLYKMLPRLLKNKEIQRVGRGQYRFIKESGATPLKQESIQPELLSALETTKPEENFVMRFAVCDIIRTFQGKEFLFDDVFIPLSQKYPNKIDETKRGSVSATLSNLISDKKLEKVGTVEGSNKAIYKATENGGLI
ncbi:MAG: hypothetical protein M3367_02830 [Acidobacteriota bacterium]|nr:hypothetical protein [Acidobacteriota bacterium]